MYEACNAGPHPLLSAADLAVVPAAVPLFSDLLAVRPRGDLTLWRDAAFKRLMRCNPFYKGDYFDPVPELPAHPKGGKL